MPPGPARVERYGDGGLVRGRNDVNVATREAQVRRFVDEVWNARNYDAAAEWVVTIMHFDGDKVVREWIGADNLGMFIQLGVVPDPWPV